MATPMDVKRAGDDDEEQSSDDSMEDVEESAKKSDSSDDSDSVSDHNEETENRIRELQKQLSANPYLYDSHVELIKLLRKEGELEKLHDAREKMSENFPLTEELWLDWVKDEMSCREDGQDRERINTLFERAVKDYMSVPVWLEYVQYSIGDMGSPGGIEKVRQVFEKALSAVGLHVSMGANIWEAYREFEMAILSGMQPELGSVASKDVQDAVTAQTNRITNLFKRQLSVPLLDMDDTYKEFEDWEVEDKTIKNLYDKTLVKLKEIQPYEEKLMRSEPPRLEAYHQYIDYELSQGHPTRIQCIFERALQENCLIPDLWLKYTKYLDEKLRIKDIILSVYERAVRNYPWNSDIWLHYVRALERFQLPHQTIIDTLEKALNAGMSGGTDFLQLWTSYSDYLRRRIDWSTDHTEALEAWRNNVERGVNHLQQFFGQEGDPTCSLQRYWARIEAKFCKNMEKARLLWNDIMALGHGNEAQMWLEFFQLERAHGDNKHCRKVLQRAVNSTNDWPESACEAFINFEREEGTLEQYDTAVQKCSAQLARVNERRETAAQKEAEKSQQKKGPGGKKGHLKTKHQSLETSSEMSGPHGQKRKFGEAKSEDDSFKIPQAPQAERMTEATPGFKLPPPPGHKGPGDDSSEPPSKKVKDEYVTPNSAKDHMTAFVSNILYAVDEDKLKEIFSPCGEITEVRLVKDFKGRSKGFAYVQFATVNAVDAAFRLDRKAIDGRPMYVSPCMSEKGERKTQFKYKQSAENNKLFIKNLPFTCTKEALQTIFSQHGELRDVRLVTYRSGAPKGLAYVEYVKESDAKDAVLKTDGLLIGDHTISVAISSPPERKQPLNKRSGETSFTPSLGGGKKESGLGLAKTKLSLLPRSLQKKQATTSENQETVSQPEKLSNADFRNMLLKK